ncbi:hypothetical protein I6J42_23665 [Streptomyces californicus]|uniref:Core-binding (CB) domain-containing protein n=1 Tax=Streptomyces californicus TaxID=67351 RepID=A0ABD7D3D4_9ACTN|nr:hypothetical protein [Streptomyces californicus]QRV36708.1 hypothetical protein I6J42_23665 [Streptomyces californicus]QRV47781.1 hypothetical protein I6J43_09955 [Streptomyces californicus]
MPRRGERGRDFHHQASPVPPARVGIRQAMTTDVNGVVRPSPFDPAGFRCRTLAEELADEWVEFVELSRLRVGTTRTYRQAIEDFCRFADGHLRDQAPAASMARPLPDLAALLTAWEGQLPSRFPLGSTRPAVQASALRTLINRRGRHPDRPLDPGLAGLAAGQHALHWGSSRELDEFSRKDKAALVAAAWKDIGELGRRLSAGRALAAEGGHPAEHGWLSLPNLLWGLANDAVTPREISRNLPALWPEELAALVTRETVPQANAMRRYFLILSLLEMLYPTQRDLHAFRVLLVAATGHAPEELTGLDEDDIEFVENGVRLTLTKHRARRIRRRAFTRIAATGTEEEVHTHTDRPRLEVAEILKRLLEVTAPLREKAEKHPAPLFMQASMSMKVWEVSARRFNPCGGPRQSFKGWLDKVGLDVEGRADVRRLRKSTKVEKAIAFGGRITDIADDHHEETFRGHYAQGTTLRVVSGKVITSAQQTWFAKATAGPVVLDDAAASSEGEALAGLGLTPEQAEDLRAGALDMGVTNCRDPFDSPFSERGQLCAVAPLRCLECRNAWILPSNLPQLLLFSDHLEAMRRRLSPVHFHTLWGQGAANLAAVLADRTEQEITAARAHIADGGASLQLPLAARAEFDA